MATISTAALTVLPSYFSKLGPSLSAFFPNVPPAPVGTFLIWTMQMNAFYLRRSLKVILPEGAGSTPVNVIASFQKNIESLGFLLSVDVFEALKRMSSKQVDSFYKRLIKDLRAMVGAHRSFEPMYPNFPAQVMEMAEAELYFNALFHYWSLELPETERKKREPLEDKPKLRLIRLGDREDFERIFTRLARSKSPFSLQDKEDVQWFVRQYRDAIKLLLPDRIPCKENLAFLGAELIRHTSDAEHVLESHVKTATDVLRLAVAMSGGDVSLAEACKFGKFRRPERKTTARLDRTSGQPNRRHASLEAKVGSAGRAVTSWRVRQPVSTNSRGLRRYPKCASVRII